MEGWNIVELLVAAITPFVSVLAAQQLVRKDAKRRDAMDAFVRATKDVQEFRDRAMFHQFTVHEYASGRAQLGDVRTSEIALRNAVTTINTDRTLLGLIFGDQGRELYKALYQFAGIAEHLTKDQYNSMQNLEDALNKGLASVHAEIRKVWDAFRMNDPFDS